MSKSIALAVGVVLAAAAAAAAAEDLEVNRVNLADSDIVGFHVSIVETQAWEETLLEGAYLPAGQ